MAVKVWIYIGPADEQRTEAVTYPKAKLFRDSNHTLIVYAGEVMEPHGVHAPGSWQYAVQVEQVDELADDE
jgi:hypothetical protein